MTARIPGCEVCGRRHGLRGILVVTPRAERITLRGRLRNRCVRLTSYHQLGVLCRHCLDSLLNTEEANHLFVAAREAGATAETAFALVLEHILKRANSPPPPSSPTHHRQPLTLVP